MTRVAAVAAPFDRDLEGCFDRIARLIADARAEGTELLVLPEAALGGYLADLHTPGDSPAMPPILDLDGPEVARVAALAREMTVCFGICEGDGALRYNTAVAVSGDGVLGTHRKVHQPLKEGIVYAAGSEFATFATPVGRLGMLICYDKAFPEAARSLALDGAQVVACLSAWPASRTMASPDLREDRWTRRFDLFDQVRALENQVVWVSANQSGSFGSMRFVASAKVVGPGGEVLATTGVAAGVASADVEIPELLAAARRGMFHLRDRRPDAYTLEDLVLADA